MFQVPPQVKVWVYLAPVDFRKQINGLTGVCRNRMALDPFSGAVFVFRNKAGTAIKCLYYDGQGFWVCHKRFSSGKLRWWPGAIGDSLTRAMLASELSVLIWNGHPQKAAMAPCWRAIV